MVTDDIIEEIARAWASIDGKAELFDRCKADQSSEDEFGHFEGYMSEARELVNRSPQLSAILSASPAPVAAGADIHNWQTRERRASILRRARELWNEDQPGCGWSDENREHYIIRAAMEAGALAAPTPPAPTQPAAEPVAVSLLARWREGEFETTADETAQIALDDQAVGLDVAPIIEAWLTAVAAPSHVAAEAQVRVKALEWEEREDNSHRGRSAIGYYHVFPGTGFSYDLCGPVGGRLATYKRLSDAKAAAQSDYDHRIRSALASGTEGSGK